MTLEHIDSVQSARIKVPPAKDTTARPSFDKSFELSPSLRDLFLGDIQESGQKLMQTVSAVVTGRSLGNSLRPEFAPAVSESRATEYDLLATTVAAPASTESARNRIKTPRAISGRNPMKREDQLAATRATCEDPSEAPIPSAYGNSSCPHNWR